MRTYARGTLVCDEGVLAGTGMTVHPDGSVSFLAATFVTGYPGIQVEAFWTVGFTVHAWLGEDLVIGQGPDHWPCFDGCD